jgi:hypothetical protein
MVQDPIRFLCDENGRMDVVVVAAPDQLLALLGKYEALVILSHDRDFRKYRSMLPEHERSRFTAGAGRLWIRVSYPRSLQRIIDEIENIEHHYRQSIRRNVPFIMEIQDATIKVTTK